MASNSSGILAGEAFVTLELSDDEYRTAMKLALKQLRELDKRASLATQRLNKLSRVFASVATRMRAFGRVMNSVIGAASRFSRLIFDTLAPAMFFLGAAAASMGSAIVAAMIPAAKSFGAMEDAISRFRVAFEDQADATEKWARSFARSIGYADSTIVDLMGRFQSFMTTQGVPAGIASTATRSIAQLVPNLASFFDISPDEVTTRLFSGLVGEMEAVRRLGVDISAQTVNRELSAFGIDPQDATQSQKVIARTRLIIEQTRKAQDDLRRTSDSLNNTLVRLSESWKRLRESIGNAIAPALTTIANVAQRIMTNLEPLTRTRRFQVLATTVLAVSAGVAALGTASLTIAPLVTAFGSLASFAALAANTLATVTFGSITLGLSAISSALKVATHFVDPLTSSLNELLIGLLKIGEAIGAAAAGMATFSRSGKGIAGLLGFAGGTPGAGGGSSGPSGGGPLVGPFGGGPTPGDVRFGGPIPSLGMRGARETKNMRFFQAISGVPRAFRTRPFQFPGPGVQPPPIVDAEFARPMPFTPRDPRRIAMSGSPTAAVRGAAGEIIDAQFSVIRTGSKQAQAAVNPVRTAARNLAATIRSIVSSLRRGLGSALSSSGAAMRRFGSAIANLAKGLFASSRVFQMGFTPRDPRRIGMVGQLIRRPDLSVGPASELGGGFAAKARAAAQGSAKIASSLFSSIRKGVVNLARGGMRAIAPLKGLSAGLYPLYQGFARLAGVARGVLRSLVLFELGLVGIKRVFGPAASVVSEGLSAVFTSMQKVAGVFGGIIAGMGKFTRVFSAAFNSVIQSLVAGDSQKVFDIAKAGFNVMATAASISFRLITESFSALFTSVGSALDGLIKTAKFLASIVAQPLEFANKVMFEGPTRVGSERDAMLESFLAKRTNRGEEEVRVIGKKYYFTDEDGKFFTAGSTLKEDPLSREFAAEFNRLDREITAKVNKQIVEELASTFDGLGEGMGSTVAEEFARAKKEVETALRPQIEQLAAVVRRPIQPNSDPFNAPGADVEKPAIPQALIDGINKIADGAGRIAQTASIMDTSARSRFGSGGEELRLAREQLATLRKIDKNTQEGGLVGVGL